MHICFLTNEYPKAGFPHGGLGSFVKTMAETLVAKGVQVTVVGLNYVFSDEIENVNGVNVIRIRKSKVKGLAWYFNSKNIGKTIAAIHKKNPIDIVEGAELSLAFLPKIKEIKYIIRLHGGHHFFAEGENRGINWWKGFQEKRSFKKAAAFIAVSNYVKSHTATYLSYHNKPIEVIFNPINSQLFQPKNVAIEPNNITFAGTICEKKGVRQLIQAFPLVKEQFPNAILNLYGRDWLFPDGSSYIKMLKEIELPKLGEYAKDVVFHGAVSFTEIPNAYAKAAVCVFPSHMETLGLVAPEAMAMEKPVVFTKLGPGPEVITDGETGWLCNPHEPKDIANAIVEVLSNPEKAQAIAKQAKRFVSEKFALHEIAQNNIDFYKKILLF
ncbi:glycosyltransferase family 4 protein [Flavobacterium proteolyticum]|uniref:Glycosyltransferase family 4 protein n=1 Tax=Flavobacterium proteolyticum TaxID=2911683 RepID=A0ABR9WTB9_9FLAO|nr:glycosyltransferase family 4 protein [Flavobacterium proteolyticum]MBE9576414.1 glycosyltransferase family 4 protein [Flavobacterium proteolyticum]